MNKIKIKHVQGKTVIVKVEKNINMLTPKRDLSVELKFMPDNNDLRHFIIDSAVIYVEHLTASSINNALTTLSFRLMNRYQENENVIDGTIEMDTLYKRVGIYTVISEIGEMLSDILLCLSSWTDDIVDDCPDNFEEWVNVIDDLLNAYVNGEVLINTNNISNDDSCIWLTRDFSDEE